MNDFIFVFLISDLHLKVELVLKMTQRHKITFVLSELYKAAADLAQSHTYFYYDLLL